MTERLTGGVHLPEKGHIRVATLVMPGLYAYRRRIGNVEETVTFQTLEEMKAYMRHADLEVENGPTY